MFVFGRERGERAPVRLIGGKWELPLPTLLERRKERMCSLSLTKSFTTWYLRMSVSFALSASRPEICRCRCGCHPFVRLVGG